MPKEMSMSVSAFVLSLLLLAVAMFPFSRFKRSPPWMRAPGILLGASGALGSAASTFSIVGYARIVLSDVALALAVAAVAYVIWAKRAHS